MIRQNHPLYLNDNYVSNTLLKGKSKNYRHIYYDKIVPSNESENIDDTRCLLNTFLKVACLGRLKKLTRAVCG